MPIMSSYAPVRTSLLGLLMTGLKMRIILRFGKRQNKDCCSKFQERQKTITRKHLDNKNQQDALFTFNLFDD